MHEAQHIANSMSFARSEAIKRNTRVNVCKSADGLTCATTGNWDVGWIVHVDTNGNGQVDSVQDIVHGRTPLAPGITVSANRPLIDYVSYTGIGHARMLSGALQMGTFTVCRSGRNGVDVVLVASGRVRIANSAAICP
jgi:type IV fimbrial biogenesis protein FimT